MKRVLRTNKAGLLSGCHAGGVEEALQDAVFEATLGRRLVGDGGTPGAMQRAMDDIREFEQALARLANERAPFASGVSDE